MQELEYKAQWMGSIGDWRRQTKNWRTRRQNRNSPTGTERKGTEDKWGRALGTCETFTTAPTSASLGFWPTEAEEDGAGVLGRSDSWNLPKVRRGHEPQSQGAKQMPKKSLTRHTEKQESLSTGREQFERQQSPLQKPWRPEGSGTFPQC